MKTQDDIYHVNAICSEKAGIICIFPHINRVVNERVVAGGGMHQAGVKHIQTKKTKCGKKNCHRIE